MKRWIPLIAVAVMLCVGCSQQSTDTATPNDTKPTIVCTIGMIADVADNIAGDHYEVIGLMGPGIDPHLYKATMRDIKAINKAEIIFYNGLHLEAKMAEILEDMGDKKTTVAVTRTVDTATLLSPPEFEGNHDPHIWFDVTLWMPVVEVIRDTLIEKDPENADNYRANANAYLKELQTLHAYVSEKAESIPREQRVLVTAHDAFGYFGRRYGFEVRGLQGISTLSEAGVSDVQEIVNFIVERKIPAIFVESSVPRRNIEAVQQAVARKGWQVRIGGELFSDAMGNTGTAEGTYIGMVKHNIDTIEAAFTNASKHEPTTK